MKLSEARDILQAECLNDCGERIVKKACAADLLSDVLAFTEMDTLLLTGMVHGQVIRTAEMLDLVGVVVVRGKKPSEEMLELAKEKGIALYSTPFNMFEAVGHLYQAGLRGVEGD